MELIRKHTTIIGDYTIEIEESKNYKGEETLESISISSDHTFVVTSLYADHKVKDIIKNDIRKKNVLNGRFYISGSNISHYFNMRCYPRIKIGSYLHIPRKESNEILDFILDCCKDIATKREDNIDSLLSEE